MDTCLPIPSPVCCESSWNAFDGYTEHLFGSQGGLFIQRRVGSAKAFETNVDLEGLKLVGRHPDFRDLVESPWYKDLSSAI
jgi:hypothetical protein